MSETVYADSSNVQAAISTGNVSVTLDLLQQWPYLLPSTSNSATIIAGLTRVANTYLNAQGGPFWSNVTSNSFKTITTTTSTSGAFIGGVLLPDGRVVFVPQVQNQIGIFNPTTNSLTLTGTTSQPNVTYVFNSGCLLPDGRVFFCPWQAVNFGVFNPVTSVYTTYSSPNLTSNNFMYSGCVVAKNGKVVCAPYRANNIGVFDPATNTFATYAGPGSTLDVFNSAVALPDGRVLMIPWGNNLNPGRVGLFNVDTNSYTSVSTGANAFQMYAGGVLVPDGRVIMIPSSAQTTVGVFTPSTNQFSTLPISTINQAYFGGCLLPNGKVFFSPQSATNYGIFDPMTNTLTTVTGATNPPGARAYNGCTLLPDGRVIMAPFISQTIGVLAGVCPIPSTFCLHPTFNKTP